MENESFLKVEKIGPVAWLILNRPKQRNTMTMEFFQEISRLFEAFDEDDDVRVVVIRAEGKSFTAGLDLVAAQSLLGDGSARTPGRTPQKNREAPGEYDRDRKMPETRYCRHSRILYWRRRRSYQRL